MIDHFDWGTVAVRQMLQCDACIAVIGIFPAGACCQSFDVLQKPFVSEQWQSMAW